MKQKIFVGQNDGESEWQNVTQNVGQNVTQSDKLKPVDRHKKIVEIMKENPNNRLSLQLLIT